MKSHDRARLTTALRDHVAKIAVDLRAKMRAPGAARVAAEQLHKDERVAEDFEVWTDLLSRRAAVLWVLKSVYVRVLEDRGLLAPGRLLDPEAQQLFERLAPNLGETAFLRWIYRDLASRRGGLPELFSPQPAEVALPSDELSRALINFWRHRDADTGAVWSFAEERFEGELMGDLYQELDPVVKDRFALCQTPDFVRAFILDRTLTPAIETFGADDVRLLDPACGSGHFLIDGLKRLVAATSEKHPDWDRAKVVAHALDRVVGIDLNDYACALARTRLIMTAAELAGVANLADAARFHPHVYWADGLEQVERGETMPVVQYSFFEDVEDRPRASFTRTDARCALRTVFANGFHAVVANPPYIVESDGARKSYQRERIGRRRRYLTAQGDYSLVGPFIERCGALSVASGFVGVIVSNAFTRKPTGEPLVREVLSKVDLQLILDSSQANIPHHGTPTVILCFQNRAPATDGVRVIIGKRSIPEKEPNGAPSQAWRSLVRASAAQTFDDSFATLVHVSRATAATHPWAFAAGVSASTKEAIERNRERTLASLGSEVGRTTVCGAEPVYDLSARQARRLGVEHLLAPAVSGHAVRDWCVNPIGVLLYPYASLGGPPIGPDDEAATRYLWRYRSVLKARLDYGRRFDELPRAWFEHYSHFADRIRRRRALTHTYVATHAHFAYCDTPRLYMKTAPALRLPETVPDADYFALLAYLNSSAVCFWLKQILHPKSHSSQRHHPDPARAVYEFTAAGLSQIPIPKFDAYEQRLSNLGAAIDRCARAFVASVDQRAFTAAVDGAANPSALRSSLDDRWRAADAWRERMVALQEEVDWTVYAVLGLADKHLLAPVDAWDGMTCPRGDRPFERIVPREATVRVKKQTLCLADAEAPPVGQLPGSLEGLWRLRVEAIQASEHLAAIENALYKRYWRDTEDNVAEPRYRSERNTRDLESWLADRVEDWAELIRRPFTIPQAAAALQQDTRALIVAEVLAGRRDYSFEAILRHLMASESVPSHPLHIYTDDGLVVRRAWEHVWQQQRREDAGESIARLESPPEFSQGSRGKPAHFLRNEYWRLRGALDVPRERFTAFTEVPGRSGVETLYGWAGWTAQQRVKATLAIDEELEDAAVPLADRIGLLDSAWRLLPDVAREDVAAANRLKAELQALVGLEGPSRELIEDWKKRFPPPTTRASRDRRAAAARDEDEDSETEESDES